MFVSSSEKQYSVLTFNIWIRNIQNNYYLFLERTFVEKYLWNKLAKLEHNTNVTNDTPTSLQTCFNAYIKSGVLHNQVSLYTRTTIIAASHLKTHLNSSADVLNNFLADLFASIRDEYKINNASSPEAAGQALQFVIN